MYACTIARIHGAAPAFLPEITFAQLLQRYVFIPEVQVTSKPKGGGSRHFEVGVQMVHDSCKVMHTRSNAACGEVASVDGCAGAANCSND